VTRKILCYAIEAAPAEKTRQRLNYLHENPVQAAFVTEARHWK
jgi:hypothetical protein